MLSGNGGNEKVDCNGIGNGNGNGLIMEVEMEMIKKRDENTGKNGKVNEKSIWKKW